MSTPILDPVRAAAIERELLNIGAPTSRLQRNQRRRRVATISLSSLVLASALTGGAIVAINLPGWTTVTPFGEIITGSYSGTANVELGTPPDNAAVVILDVTCTEGGAMEVPMAGEGNRTVSWNCSDPIREATTHIRDGRLPDAGTTFITVTADPGTEWTITAQYATSDTTEWGVNTNGQTYGIANDNGIPDLVAAMATNGRQGYTSTIEMNQFEGEGFINVYSSDGTTVIGKFPIGDVQ